MGQELRSIVLTDAEFTLAAGLYFEDHRDTPIKSSNIKAVLGPSEPNGDAVVQFNVPLVDGQSSIALSPRDVVDIVVRFCKEKAVPLPRSGRKTVLRRGDQLVLEIELDWF